jgi:molybdopterin-guanine dinucleotide biosynthesis protein A
VKKINITSLILAGKRQVEPLSNYFGIANKAFLPLCEKPLIEWVISALKEANLTDNLLITASQCQEILFKEKLPQFANKLILVPPLSSPMDGVSAALKLIPPENGLLITTADNPLLTKEQLEYFIDEALNSEDELVIGCVNGLEGLVQKYPNLKRTWHKINSKTWISGANLFFFAPQKFSQHTHTVINQLERQRKSPLGFAQIVSKMNCSFFIKLLFQQSSLQECNKAMSQALGVKTKLLTLPFPEACVDVDKFEDLELAQQIISERRSSLMVK